MRERPNRMVSKTIVAQVTVGSNPTPSATTTQARDSVLMTCLWPLVVSQSVGMLFGMEEREMKVFDLAERCPNGAGAATRIRVAGVVSR